MVDKVKTVEKTPLCIVMVGWNSDSLALYLENYAIIH